MKHGLMLSLSGLLVAGSGCALITSEQAHVDKLSCAKPMACAACPASVHPDSRNWSSLFNLDLTNAVFTKGVAITADSPAAGVASVTGYTVSPALPAGLSL